MYNKCFGIPSSLLNMKKIYLYVQAYDLLLNAGIVCTRYYV